MWVASTREVISFPSFSKVIRAFDLIAWRSSNRLSVELIVVRGGVQPGAYALAAYGRDATCDYFPTVSVQNFVARLGWDTCLSLLHILREAVSE